jgi:hypothetical protein
MSKSVKINYNIIYQTLIKLIYLIHLKCLFKIDIFINIFHFLYPVYKYNL